MNRRALVLAGLLWPALASAQPDNWTTVVGPDLRFRLEMPAPVKKTEVNEKEKGQAGPRSSWSSKRDEEMFDFDYVDYDPKWFTGGDTRKLARDLGRGEAEKAFPRATYKYVRDEPVTLQGWDGYALDIEDATGAGVLMRTYIVKDRLYNLLVTFKPGNRAPAQRFIDSLRLAETRQ